MKMYTVEEVAATIDHAVLRPDQTETDLRRAADMCRRFGVASMCVRPADVKISTGLLAHSPVLVSTVISFPHGSDTCAAKIFQTQQAIADGAREIDMVMNIGRFLSGDHAYVRNEIRCVVETAHAQDVLVKVIQESCFLSPEEIADACILSLDAGADFVKTSTGFGPSSATPEIIDVMVKTVGGKMGIKASGGIKTWEQAVAYLRQGATRLGIGSTEAVLSGHISLSEY